MTEVEGHESNQPPPPFSDLLGHARALASEGAYEEMLEVIQQVIARNPQDEEEFQAFLLRARALEGLGQTEQGRDQDSSRCSCRDRVTASPRDETPSLRKTDIACALTVCGDK